MARKEQPRIRSVILCDDVRTEVTGKDICIGVYNGIILVGGFPAALPKLMIRIEFEYPVAGEHLVEVSVTGPKNVVMFKGRSMVRVEAPGDPGVLSVGFGPVHLLAPGKFTVHLGMGGEPRPISRFEVRTHPSVGTVAQ